MAKLTLDDVTNVQSDQAFIATINANSDTLEEAFDNTLSRDGTTPNQMGADLDMNAYRILNLPTPLSLYEPLRLKDLEDLAGGSVTINNSDASLIPFTPTAEILSDNVQDAIEEVRDAITASLAYSTGTWTPTFDVATPGDISINYFSQVGTYTRIGDLVFILCDLVCQPTWSTSSGQVTIGGIPFSGQMDEEYLFPLSFSGITKATYTQFWIAGSTGATGLAIEAAASAVPIASVGIASFPSGGIVVLRFSGFYRIA